MTRYDDFDLDLQNTKACGATPDITVYSKWLCPTIPVIECFGQSRDCQPEPEPPEPPGPPATLTIEVCPYGNR